jgi:hypothetical protein
MSIRAFPIDNGRRLSTWLLGAILTLGLTVLLAPSAASAARHGACSITIAVAPAPIKAGEGAGVSGVLSCASPEVSSEQTVSVHCRSAGASGSSICATATTATDGSFKTQTEPLQTNSLLFAGAQGARSPRIEVKLGALVSITSAPADGAQLLLPGQGASASALSSNTVIVSGTVSPVTAGTRVALQRERPNGRWQRIALGEVTGEGTYSITHTFLLPGSATVRVVARGHGNLDTASETRTYLISRRQRPDVSIEASASSLAPGTAVTISGTVAGAPEQPVTLLARTRGGRFAPLGTSTTDSRGKYSFAPQLPQQSTIYRVTAGHAGSISLPVDVETVTSP